MPEAHIPEQVAPADAVKIKVTLREIKIDGATVFSDADFKALTAPLIGREIPLSDVFKLADQITARYRQGDYILSRAVVPAQKLENGVLHIRIVEGYIASVAFDGPKNRILQGYADRLTAERPIRGAVLERYLLLMNSVPGVSARAVLAPATGQTGGSNVSLVTTEKNYDAYASINNQGSRYIGPVESSVGIALNNIAGLGERTQFSYSFAYPQSQLQYFALHEEVPLTSSGLLLTLDGGLSVSKPGFNLRPLDARARGNNFSIGVSYPLIRTRAQTWTISSKFDVIDSRTRMYDRPHDPPSSNDQIRALRVATAYDFADTWGGHNLINGEFSLGLDMLGASDFNRPNPSRPGGRSDFRKLTLDVSRRQELDVIANNLDFLVSAVAQTTFGQKQLSTEQFGAGGAVFGRGYEPSEITGDDGFAAKAELQYTVPVEFLQGGVQFFTFFDTAAAHNHAYVAGLKQNSSLSSTGVGLRFDAFEHWSGSVSFDKPLTKEIETERLAGHDPKPWRVLFDLTMRL